MRYLNKLKIRLNRMHPLCLISFRLGAALMLACYISAVIARLSAPVVPDYFYAMALYRGALETAPACLAAGVCAGFLGDMMLAGVRREDNDDRENKG